ncbi:Heat shock factor 2-binding protein, putative [Pediculus humanus corporis]|uniref:Heat shock factor 2-binding protein, putative n=1 Tax=Pediculus humanus subsp. corporis TaxID=121224 RepID=E0VTP7_PEDHC|nr:Heat shock factor 2-binding protein, putative [Pediculus humanus corporis]EEB16753.1 Heat shock factor 2-binding protein, putative [Pediculus humanus corporis]
MPTLKEELEEVKLKYNALREEWGLQQEHLGRLQTQISGLHNQLQQQSAFCASLGAILGHLLWKASRSPEIVETLTAGNKIGDFFLIVVGTLTSFMDTYRQEIPNQNSDESQFVMSLVGIVTNIAATSEGRLFLIVDEQGKNLVRHFVKILQFIPVPSGNCLKRLIFMTLYNISINSVGVIYLQGQNQLLIGIAKTLVDDTQPQELHLMALRLLQSITWEINCKAVLENIAETVGRKLLDKFLRSTNQEFSTASTAIITNIERNKMKIQNLQECGGKYSECDNRN